MTAKSVKFTPDSPLKLNTPYTFYCMSGKKVKGTLTHHCGHAVRLSNATVKPHNQPPQQVGSITLSGHTIKSYYRHRPVKPAIQGE